MTDTEGEVVLERKLVQVSLSDDSDFLFIFSLTESWIPNVAIFTGLGALLQTDCKITRGQSFISSPS